MRFSKIRVMTVGIAVSALVLAGCGSSGTSEESGAPSDTGSSAPAESSTDEAPAESPSDDAEPTSDEGGESAEATGDPITVVVLGGTSAEGILGDNATTSVTSAIASVDAVNADGGILGHPVEIKTIDDTADPTVAVTKLRELLASGVQPVAVMNSGPSTIAEATLPILTQEKILSFNIGPTATSGDPASNPYNFDLSASVSDYLGGFVAELTSRGYKSIAIIHGSSAYSESFGKTAEEIFTGAGFTVTGNEGFDNAALDMTPQLATLQDGNPDVLVLDAYGAPLGYVLQGIQKLGWDIPIMADNSVSATGLVSKEAPDGVLGTDQVKNLTMQVFLSTKYDESNQALNDAVQYMLAAGPIKSTLINAYNFDSMPLLKAAAEKANSLDAEALAEAMIDPSVQETAKTVIQQRYNFTADSHTPHTAPDDLIFISPGPLVNGQFQ